MRFIFEEWTETYRQYDEGIPENKIVYDAKKLAELVALQLSRLVGRKGMECAE